MTTAITTPQLKRLNTLFGQWARHFAEPTDRETRLATISARLGRPVTSTREMSKLDATRVIDSLQADLAIPETRPAPQRTQRERDQRGTEGRGDQLHAESTMVSAGDLARIQSELIRLGWDQAHLEAWLRSARGPLGRRTAIRTLGDANRVFWALAHMKPRTSPGKEQASA